ncbi:MAG: hypothetical protein LUF28_01480 [Clostridiales bacterium]|nr:hypothetical protein [Clostridiales bacterium]
MDIYENNKICSIGYELSFAGDFTWDAKGVPGGLDRCTVQYAVRRYLKRNNRLLAKLVRESYAIRLSSGRNSSRPRRLVCVTHAKDMELPGNWVEMKLLIDAKGITVRKLRILPDYPAQGVRKPYRATGISSWTPEDHRPDAVCSGHGKE